MKNLGQARYLPILAIAYVLLVALSTSAVAADPAEGIVITLPADLSAEQREVLVDALERLGQPVVVDDPAVSPTEDAAVGGLALAIGRFDDAMLAAGQVPSLLDAWWLGLTGTGGLASLLAVVAGAVALAAGLGLEYLVDRLVDGWRQACLTARTQRFAQKLGLALGWFGLEIARARGVRRGLASGRLADPARHGARAPVAGGGGARGDQGAPAAGIGTSGLCAAHPEPAHDRHAGCRRQADLPLDRGARRWSVRPRSAFATCSAGAGATADAVAFLGIMAAAVTLVARLVAFVRTARADPGPDPAQLWQGGRHHARGCSLVGGQLASGVRRGRRPGVSRPAVRRARRGSRRARVGVARAAPDPRAAALRARRYRALIDDLIVERCHGHQACGDRRRPQDLGPGRVRPDHASSSWPRPGAQIRSRARTAASAAASPGRSSTRRRRSWSGGRSGRG